MKYFLVLGIEFKKYKRPANITVHVGDKFIDEFQLDRDFPCTSDVLPHLEHKSFQKCGRPEWLTRPDWIDTWTKHKIPTLFKVYELDDIDLEGKLTIKVDNSNSDFTNGFMKNSSTIRLAIPALLKKDQVAKRGEKIMKALIQLDKDMFLEGRKKNHITKDKRWPVADWFQITRENNMHLPTEKGDRWWRIGGSFTAEFEIVKTQYTKYLGVNQTTEWGDNRRSLKLDDLVVALCTRLLNIYNEDQRGNITRD